MTTTAQVVGFAIIVIGAITFAAGYMQGRSRRSPRPRTVTRLYVIGAALAFVGALVMWVL
jgi:hypothetical protein